MRYDYFPLEQISSSGKRVLGTVLYPEIELSDTDIYVQSKDSDRLDLLAFRYYKDVNLWWIIAHANKIKGTFYTGTDKQLRIPMNLQKILNDYYKLNI
jgi:hypothetical protein